jgi:hypothetical protein
MSRKDVQEREAAELLAKLRKQDPEAYALLLARWRQLADERSRS